MNHHFSSLSIFIIASFAVSSCGDRSGGPTQETTPGKPVVHAVNYPLFYFAQRIGGDLIDLHFNAPAGIDPAFWKPSDDDIAAMQRADLILLNGAGYAKWTKAVSLPLNTRVDTSEAFADQVIETEGGVAHQHGDGELHTHGETAFTTWLDMQQAIAQARAIQAELARMLPDSVPTLELNTAELVADLEELDRQLLATGKKLAGKPLFASHPVYQYLARRYGLKIHAFHWEPGVVPGDDDLLEMDVVREEHAADVVIWEGEPIAETVALLEKDGIRGIVFDPCGNRPGEGDWLSVMKQNVANLDSL